MQWMGTVPISVGSLLVNNVKAARGIFTVTQTVDGMLGQFHSVPRDEKGTAMLESCLSISTE